MPRFRKKPIEIEAVQWTGGNTSEICRFVGGVIGTTFEPEVVIIKTKEGWVEASPGDWIIKGVQGEFYPCKPDIFEATYDACGEPDKPGIVITDEFHREDDEQ